MSIPAVKIAPLKNVVFDLGAVLVDWNPEDIATRFAQDERQKQQLLETIFYHQDWKRLDLGEISLTEATANFAENSGLDIATIEKLMRFIKNYLKAKPDSVTLLEEMHQKAYRVFCLSNICRELFDHIAGQNSFFALFEDAIVSAEVKLAKPDPEIFRYMLNRFGISAEETLFIDDMPDNVASAGQSGIHTIQFTEIDDCRRAISQLIG